MSGNHTPEGDVIEQDLDDDANYCKHGTFIGNPYGGDYLCGPCEMGDDEDDFIGGEDDHLEAAYEERFEMHD